MVENLSKNKQDGGIYKEEEDNVAFIRWWSPGWTTSKHVETTLETFYDCQQTTENEDFVFGIFLQEPLRTT